MKWRLRRIITCVIVVFTIILVSACNMKNKSFELKQEGVYSNYIRAARDYHEKIYGKNGIFRYGNVLNEHMQTREHMAQSNGNESILTYFVLLVYEENGQQIASNYLCEVKKSEFEKIVKKNIVKETSYVEDAVKASDKVTSNRS